MDAHLLRIVAAVTGGQCVSLFSGNHMPSPLCSYFLNTQSCLSQQPEFQSIKANQLCLRTNDPCCIARWTKIHNGTHRDSTCWRERNPSQSQWRLNEQVVSELQPSFYIDIHHHDVRLKVYFGDLCAEFQRFFFSSPILDQCFRIFSLTGCIVTCLFHCCHLKHASIITFQ